MRHLRRCFAALLLFASVSAAQPQAPLPIKDGEVLPLWPGGAPGAQGTADADVPALTVFLPRTMTANTPAMIVCPAAATAISPPTMKGARSRTISIRSAWRRSCCATVSVPAITIPIELGDAQRAIRTAALARGRLADRSLADRHHRDFPPAAISR